MAKRVAKFEKVSFEQFEKDWKDTFGIPNSPIGDEFLVTK